MSSPLGQERTLKPRVFVSHSHKDEVYARKIVSWLEKIGFEPWASFEECSDKYRVEIDSALLSCNIFLLIASKDAFSSVEVRREINVAGSASLEKPIAYYRLDGAGHNREGFLTLLSEKQYIQASRLNLELARLAEYLFEIWDGNTNEDIRHQRKELIQNSIAIEEANLMRWRDKLWNLRLDANNNPRKLSSADRDILQTEAKRLGIIVSIDDENQSFSFNKSSFQRDLIGIIAKRRIDAAMVNQIETKRLECSVSEGLAVTLLNKRLEKIDYLVHLSLTKSAGKLNHWLALEIKKAQNKHLGASAKDKLSGNSFSFKQLIWPLEYYRNGACELKMDVMSLSLAGGSIRFHGLQGRKPFSFSTSVQVTNIATGTNHLLINLDGYETRIVLRLDKNSTDYGNLLQFLAGTTEHPIENPNSDHDPNTSSNIETQEKCLPSSDDKTNSDHENISIEAQNPDHARIDSQGSDEPDSFFYIIVAIVVVLAIGGIAVREIFQALASVFGA